ncbi:GPR endopeptidase [Heliophilum fasciatum]|uniref:Germination protease n=1 Tax=Heliophilum fasciatum TaxID=35700 RepID=A0A4V2SWW3_9FIRM|nr:GPR endopeptidase [Heliophilum fasciatum]MCW2278405.1 spore protease [Heliophilum fasciatum]TCP63696.1 spore protease [Heliophilum fasciatum]
MERSALYEQLGIRLDMAVEAHEILRQERNADVPGVRIIDGKHEHATVTTVIVESAEGEQAMGKPRGTYITIDAPEIRVNNREIHQKIAAVVASELSRLARLGPQDNVLVVGLGNWHATPDALGPKVVDMTLVTRHLHKYAPEELQGGLRSVSAFAPGVLGLTGIETAEMIKGVVDRTQPSLVIAIDALATRSVERIATSIQLADTGIHPGSGVGNKRSGINRESMGVPVIAMGIPTVVHAGVIAHEAIAALLQEFQTSPTLYKLYKGINPDALQSIIQGVLGPEGQELIMTPKEIDQLIQNTSRIVAAGIGQALHPGIDTSGWTQYLQ